MMWRILFALCFGFFTAANALAQPCGSYPNTLANGQPADANQVMANFNFIRNCVNSGLSVTIDDVNRRNILLNTAALAKANGNYIRNLNTFADGYKTTDGINTTPGVSSGYSVVAASGYVTSGATKVKITNVTTITTGTGSTGWTRSTAAFDGITDQADTAAAFLSPSNNLLNNALGQDFGAGNDQIVTQVKIYPVNNDVLRGDGPASLGINVDGSSNGSAWSNLYAGNITVMGPGGTNLVPISNTTPYRYYRVNLSGNGSNAFRVAEVEFWKDSAGNMILVTTSQTADASVSNGRVLLEYNPSDPITLNTDLTVEVTCSGGANWTAATLAAVGKAQAGHTVAETADTACTAGTSFAARIKTFNTKTVQIFKTTMTVH